jgi:hypothetical protein
LLFRAWLYTFSHAENPYYHDAETLRRAEAGWDYYASIVLSSGLAPIVTRDRYWFDGNDAWGFYYWLQTFDLTGEHLAPEKSALGVECLHRIGKPPAIYTEGLVTARRSVRIWRRAESIIRRGLISMRVGRRQSGRIAPVREMLGMVQNAGLNGLNLYELWVYLRTTPRGEPFLRGCARSVLAELKRQNSEL